MVDLRGSSATRAQHISGLDLVWAPRLFYTYRLEKLLCLELSRSPNGFFKALVDPGGGFRSETAVAIPFRK
jgi:hypothetical protein